MSGVWRSRDESMNCGYNYSMAWRDRIVSEPEVLRGKPCIKGTRIPVALVLGYLAVHKSTAEILSEFPGLTAADVAAALEYARFG